MGLNKEGYYTLDDIKKTGCQWRWIFGPRAPGKSAAVKTAAMKRAWAEKQPTMGLIRRRKVEVETSEVEHYFEDKGINFVVGKGVAEIIATKSVDGGRGARDIRRNIRKDIEDKIADILIERAEQETSEISVTAVKDEIKVAYKK